MKRGVGFCETVECEDYAKGVFLMNPNSLGLFNCPRCRGEGTIVEEGGTRCGNSNVFKEVRVEYCWDNVSKRYHEIAIVRDEALWGRCNTYTLFSPLIKTEMRGLKVAEAVLSNLNKFSTSITLKDLDEGKIPTTQETLLRLDDDLDTFKSNLNKLAADLEKSPLVRREGI